MRSIRGARASAIAFAMALSLGVIAVPSSIAQTATTTRPRATQIDTPAERRQLAAERAQAEQQGEQRAQAQQAQSQPSNNGPSTMDRFKGAIDSFVGFIPNLIGGLLTLLIGYIIAKVLYNILLRVLPRLGLDRFLVERGFVRGHASAEADNHVRQPRPVAANERAAANEGSHKRNPVAGIEQREHELENRYPGASWLASAAFWLVMLVVFSQVAQAWHWQMVSNGIARILAYVPHLIAAAIIFGATLLIADWVRDRAVGEARGGRSELIGGAVKAVILTFGGFLALRELQIAPDIVRIAFTLILGSIAVAAALAVGLGGRTAVEQMTTDMYSRTRPDAATRIRDAA